MDAQLNELIRLKQPLPAPVERWQMVPTRQPLKAPRSEVNSPLRIRTPNVSNLASTKTPEKFVIKYKRSPRKGKTPCRTPGKASHSKRTPPKSARKKSPGRAGQSPSGCRFIPNRNTTDIEYSSYLLQRQEGEREEEEEEEDTVESPTREEYRHALLKAVSKSRPQSQRGVLSFSSTTPSIGEGIQQSKLTHA